MTTDKKKIAAKELLDLPGEVWKELKFTERRYDVSNKGRVKSYFFKEDGKIISPGYIKDFAVVNLKVDGKIKSYYVHKLVADAFIKKDKEAV